MRCPRCGASVELALELTDPCGPASPGEREADELREIVAQMRRAIAACRRKPGAAEATRHLLDHVGLKIDGALRILRELEGRDIDREGARAALKNGRRRCQECRFCVE